MRPKRKAAEDSEVKRKKAKTGDDHAIPKFNLSWSMHGASKGGDGVGTLMVLDGDQPGSTKVAGFDIDFTIIQTESGRKFATGAKDWTWLYDCIPDKLRALNKDGYKVVFFTNQAGIEKQKVKPTEIITKVNDITEQLDIPIFCLVCTGQNEFRKPSTSMWDYFVKNCNKGVEVDLSKSLYVGDAAGRPKEWAPGKGKDFSCSDRMFAANIGIEFQTPEEYFLNEAPAKFDWRSLDPMDYLKRNPPTNSKSKQEQYHSKEQELVLLVGQPACGKSTFAKRYLVPNGYVHVNRDTLKTPAKCMQLAKDSLKGGKSVVVDNTNPAAHTRAEYIKIANKAKVPCRCFVMETPNEVTHHLNIYRQNQTMGKVRRIPDVAYKVYAKHFEQPDVKEGFKEVKKTVFAPQFDNSKDEQLFKQWTTGGH